MIDVCQICGGEKHLIGCIHHPEFLGSKEETLKAHGWTPWPGGKQPVADDWLVTVVLRNGNENTTLAGLLQWNRTGAPSDIIGWRTGRVRDIDLTPGKVHWVGEPPKPSAEKESPEDHPLYPIFMAAIEQAMYGKGERHGGARTPFLEQPWVHYLKMHGRGFATGQAAKKLEEAASTRSGEGFETEVFGAIVYAGMAILKERGQV